MPLDKTKYLSKLEFNTDATKTVKRNDPNYIFSLGLKQTKDDDEAMAPFQHFVNFREDERTMALARENFKKDSKNRRNKDYNPV